MNKPRLVLVEDEAVIAMDLQRRLRTLGYEVVAWVDSGEAAVKSAGESKPDLVLMDISLEGEMDGIAAAIQIERLYDIPVVYMTAQIDTHTLNRLKEAGASGCLIKPIRDQELIPAIELTRLNRSRRAWNWNTLEEILLQTTDAALVAHGPEQTVRYANEAALRILHCEPGEVIGRKFCDVLRVEDLASGSVTAAQLDRWLCDLSESRASRPVLLTSTDDRKRWVEVSAVKRISQEDVHYVILFRGSNNIRLERRSTKGGGVKVLEALASADVGVWKWNASTGRFHWFATQGYKQDHAVIESKSLETFAQAIHRDDQGDFLKAFRGAQQEAGTVEIEARMVGADGTRWVTFLGAPTSRGNKDGIYAGIWRNSPDAGRDRLQLTAFRTALERVRQGVTVSDVNGKILYVNSVEAEMHGYRPEELIGRQAGILGWEELRQQPASRSSQPWKRETVNQRKDGSVFSVVLTTETVFDERDAPCFQVTISELNPDDPQDVDEPSHISMALEQTASAILITDTQGKIQYVNQALCEMTGHLREETIGRQPNMFKSGKHDREFYRELWATIQEGRPWRGVLLNKRKNGELYFNECQISPLVDRNGVITHFVSTGRDITEETKLREQLKRKESMELMGRMVGGVAHEVRNPLNVIQASIEAGATEVPAGEWASTLEVIRTQVERLSFLMKDLLELGKPLQESRLQVENLTTLCRMAITSIRKMFPGHTFVLEAPGEEPLFVRVDPSGMYQVLHNLLENAAQHSPVGQVIEVRLREDGESQVFIEVCDRGSGIPPENFLQLFEPFFTTRRGGTGLGLSIVRHVVEAHGGYVTAQNNDPPPGVTFEVHLPEAVFPKMS